MIMFAFFHSFWIAIIMGDPNDIETCCKWSSSVTDNAICSKINKNTTHMNDAPKCTTVLCIHTHTAVCAAPVIVLNQITYRIL
jgi:hypothetical protein